MMSEEISGVKKSLTDLIPQEWFSDPATSSVWIAGFRVAGGSLPELANGIIVDLIGTRAFVLYGHLSYLDTSGNHWEWSEQSAPLCKIDIKEGKTSIGSWLIIMAPYKIDGIGGNEAEVKRTISTSAGIIAAFSGRNAVYEKIYDNILDVGTGAASGFSPVFSNPWVFPHPNFSKDRVALIRKGITCLNTIAIQMRNRIELAMHWYEEALRDQGRDAFLKSWIALEVLAMPDSTNVRPITEALARAYSISYDEATKAYGVGRIFGLRSRIVHNGELLPIHFLLEEYTQAIFADVLFDMLQLPSDRRIEAVKAKPEFDLNGFLQER